MESAWMGMGQGMNQGMMAQGMGNMGAVMGTSIGAAAGGGQAYSTAAMELVGLSPDGRCVALPALNAGTVTTIKDNGAQLIIGVWRITGQQPMAGGGVAVTVQLPGIIVVDKTTGNCVRRPSSLSLTFRGPGLANVLDQAAAAWCRTV